MSGPNPSFQQFQSLPVEIHLMIWSLHHGRIIEIYPIKHGFAARPTSAPALLHVNRESRAYARRSYDIVDLAPIARFEDRDQVGVLRTDPERLDESMVTERQFPAQRYDAESLYFAKATPDGGLEYRAIGNRWSIIIEAQVNRVLKAHIRFCDIVQGNGDVYDRLRTADTSFKELVSVEGFYFNRGGHPTRLICRIKHAAGHVWTIEFNFSMLIIQSLAFNSWEY